MDRRTFIGSLAGGFLSVPRPAVAQRTTKVWRVGYLEYSYPTRERDMGVFRQRLRELGYVEGKNLAIESRVVDPGFENVRALATELVGLKADVIAASGNATIAALIQATRTIPIVMISSGDPVGAGFVSSLAHPGGNVTGLANLAEGLSAKWLELLTQTAPGITQVGVLMVPDTSAHVTYLKEIKSTAQRTGIAVRELEVRSHDEIERAFTGLAKARAQGLIVLPNPVTLTNQVQIVELAAKNRLPVMYPWPEFIESGGLMAYSSNRHETYRRAADFVDRILKGAKPAELPIEQPTKFELVVNLRTARALGLTIPAALLQRADRVIE